VNSGPRQIVRWESGAAPVRALDELAGEEPLEIRIDNKPVSVTMRTPGHDDELAAGLLLSEGLIRRQEQILKIAHHPRHRGQNVVGVFLAPDTEVDLRRLDRHFPVSSSCGLCGKTSIASVRQRFPSVKTKVTVAASILLRLPETLRERQSDFDRTGGLHAAGLFEASGRLLVAREDVGRHNAVDKVLGHALLNGWIPLRRHVLFVSGRVSFEIVQKALAGGIPVIAAVSAPTSLAVEMARSGGQTLVGFVRGRRLNVYAHAGRVKFD